MSDQELIRAPKGLAGVIADESAISNVLVDPPQLIYRGYPAEELARECRYEEVAHLLWTGELPDGNALARLLEKERQRREVDPQLIDLAFQLARQDAHPMDLLQAATVLIGADDRRSERSREILLDQAITVWAKLPTLIAAYRRFWHQQEAVEPDPDLSYAENFLAMSFGEEPDPEAVEALETSLVLYAEHGFNASTFTARVVASTEADLFSAASSAVGALKGALHGGANEEVMKMLNRFESPDEARDWTYEALAEKKKIMGFGHRVYRKGDSRVPIMRERAKRLAEATGNERLVAIAEAIEEVMIEEKGIHPNLDYPAGPLYHMMGLEIPLYTPIFAMTRVVGWTAHVMEQLADNRIIRPLSDYTGPDLREVPPIDHR